MNRVLNTARLLGRARGWAALLFLGGLLRLWDLGAKSLWFDEANTLCVAREPLGRILPLVRVLEGAPPLHYLLLHFWLPWTGDPLLGLRAFSVSCSIAGLAVFWRLLRQAASGREAMSFFIACFSSFWLHIAQDGRTYALFLLLALLCARCLFLLKERWSWRPAAAYAAVATAGLYTHNFFLFLLLSDFVDLCLHHRRRPRRLLPWLGLYAAVLAAYAPWLSSLLAQIRSWSAITMLAQALTPGQFIAIFGDMFLDTGFLGILHRGLTRSAGVAALAAVGAGIVLAAKAGPREDRRVDLSCLIHIAVPLAAAKFAEWLLHRPLTQTRYFVFISPYLYLWVGLILERIKGRLGALLRVACAAAVLAGTVGYFVSARYVDPRLERMRDALRAQTDRRRPILHLDPAYYTPMRFYYLPERPHFLADAQTKALNWAALPGYPAKLPAGSLRRLGPCDVIDPSGRFFPRRYGTAVFTAE